MAKRGRKAKAIDVPEHVCPHCGKIIAGMQIKAVTDKAAIPAVRHYEIVRQPEKGRGGLYDQKED